MSECSTRNAFREDFTWTYTGDLETVKWPRPYRFYHSHIPFNKKIQQISKSLGQIRKVGETCVTAHSATIQPFVDPKPGAKPNEDAHTVQFWEMKTGTWIFAAVFDGHAGPELSALACQELPAQISRRLEILVGNSVNITRDSVSKVLTESIQEYDNSLLEKLLRVLPRGFETMSEEELATLVNDQDSGGTVYNACIPCMRGSTALIALIDPTLCNLWVSNLGDSQATYVEYPVNAPNEFKTQALCSPHTAGAEKEELRSQHPDEPEVAHNGRVLGALSVTRALGDFIFKLPAYYAQKLFLNVREGFRVPARVIELLPRNITPPYVSAVPEVRYRLLRRETEKGFRTRHALVLCSDGLTDLYRGRGWTKEGAVRQIGRTCIKHEGKHWEGLNGNLALHLIKNALGDNLDEQCKQLFVNLDFQHMDDTTAVVLSW